jgi:glycosyltransferase involved in cell wall biosynthesis
VVPNGIDLERFQQPAVTGRFRSRLGLESEASVLLSVGRLDPEKSLDFLIGAFARIAAQAPRSHLVLAGDGSARPALERAAAATGCGERIHFLGMLERAEIPQLLAEADLFLSASTSEVHPLAVIEAAAAGLPIVAVRDEALEGIVADRINGRLTPREIEPFNRAITDLLGDRAARQAFGRASAEISRKFSLEAQARALTDLYRQLLAFRK